MREFVVAGNWKMNPSAVADAMELAGAVRDPVGDREHGCVHAPGSSFVFSRSRTSSTTISLSTAFAMS